jgi:hypothetical protein
VTPEAAVIVMTKLTSSSKIRVIHIQTRDRVADLLRKIAGGQVKSGQLSKEIEDFDFDELEKLSDGLIEYYERKFQ